MESGLIDSIGKLSIEVVSILTLAYIVWSQGKGHEKMSKSIDRLTFALTKKLDRDNIQSKSLRKSMEAIDGTLKSHRIWSEKAVEHLSKRA